MKKRYQPHVYDFKCRCEYCCQKEENLAAIVRRENLELMRERVRKAS